MILTKKKLKTKLTFWSQREEAQLNSRVKTGLFTGKAGKKSDFIVSYKKTIKAILNKAHRT